VRKNNIYIKSKKFLMKTKFISLIGIGILILGAVFFAGCSRDQEVVSSVEEQSVDQRIIDMVQKATDDPVLQKEMQEELQFLVDYHGEQIHDIRIKFNDLVQDFVYVSGGDQIISREYVWQAMREHKENTSVSIRSHRGHGTVGSPGFVSNGTYTIYVHSGVPSAWSTAVAQAISAWNGLGLTVSFGGASTGNIYNAGAITVYMNTLGSGIYAEGYLPNSGLPGYAIEIDPTNGTSLNASQKKLIMAHEIGHTIGFRHTDTSNGHALVSSSYSCIV
jgi:hypothetical protein